MEKSIKSRILSEIESIKTDLVELSHKIHSHPEVAFEEHQAAKWQIELLKRHGFQVENPVCGMDTAYRAVFTGRGKGPRVAIIAEYDALQGAGHACGHNVIAANAVGAAIGLSKFMDQVDGEIVVFGAPAEESGGGKIIMVDQGLFKDVDFAMMVHPSTKNIIGRGGLACVTFAIEFLGKAAHSARPEKGINALTSLISFFNNIDILRQTWQQKQDPKINGIITAGGLADNIVPEYAAASFTVRAKTRSYLQKMIEDLKRIAELSAAVTGAKVNVKLELIFAERYPNMTMGESFKANMALLGETMNYPEPDESVGSSDIGNVSIETPSIHEYLWIAPEDVVGHSSAFKEAAISKRADEVVIKAAQGLALTAWDILTNTALREKIYDEFKAQVKRVQ